MRHFWLFVVCLALVGCRHKTPPLAAILPPPQPVPVAQAQAPDAVAPVAAVQAPVTSVVVAPKKVKKPKKKVVAPAPAAPVQVATAGPAVPAANVIGALTAGGEGSPEVRQKAVDLVTTLEKRLGALPKDVAERQKDQVARVRNFVLRAKGALEAGDGDGAYTLATKAKVLLDEVGK